ncbi:MAG TPA: hypothetical protein VIG41_13280, partial [Micrococcaceae bacterium]
PRPGPRHTVETRTPTGHTYRSTAPPLPGTTLTPPGTSERVQSLRKRQLHNRDMRRREVDLKLTSPTTHLGFVRDGGDPPR